MSGYRLVKSMARPLTEDEKADMRQFISQNEDSAISVIAAHFESKWNMPVTETCVRNRMIELITNQQGEKA